MNLRKARLRTATAVAVAAATGFAVLGAAPAASAAGGPAPLTPQLIQQLSQGPKQPVIVLLKDQHSDLPPTRADGQKRAMTTQSDQAPLVTQAKQTGATKVTQFSVLNGFSATMTTAEASHLATDPQVQAIVPDLPVRQAPAAQAGTAAPGATPKAAPGVCPAPGAQPLLEPEALQVTNAAFNDKSTPQAQNLATGKGVKVAYLADGVDIDNPDFIRADGSKVFSDYKDFTGEGTATAGDDREAFGDASSIAAQGRQTYDLSTYVNPGNPLPANCDIKIRGMAPDASLVGLKVIASNGFGSTSAVVQAIDYAVNVDHVDIINESLGANPYPDSSTDPFTLADNAAVAAGVTVVNSAGDAGYGNTTDSPASDPDIISAGASTTYRIMAQTRGSLPGLNGTWEDDNVSAISSSGITESGRVYDLEAPGDEGWALCTADPKTYLGCVNLKGQPSGIQAFGGTSQASPLIAGAAALVIQAYAATHGNVKPAPALVKQILTSTATDENDPSDRQGAGLLNALAAVQAARSVHDANGSPQATGNGLLFSSSQLDASGNPNSHKVFGLKVTNVGASTQTVSAHTRTLDRVKADDRGTVNLNLTGAGPSFTGPSGATDLYSTQKFTIAPGTDHLDASLSWSSPSTSALTMVLLDPKGGFAGYTFPQASVGPDFGHVDVHTPMAGTWTAIFYGAKNATGFNGPVHYEFTSTDYSDLGGIAPGRLRLAPGQTGTLYVQANTPAKPGDLAAAVELDSSTQQHFAVPMILRSLVPNNGRGTFSGVLTGGNGRAGGPAQMNTYRFTVPPGKHDVDVSMTLKGDSHQNVIGYLVSPDGQILSQASNVRTEDANGNPTAYDASLQDYARNPRPGLWSFVAVVGNPVSGSATQEPFTGAVTFDQVRVNAPGVPDSPHTVLPAGKPASLTLTVRNTGAAPGSYFVDARTRSMVDAQLTPAGPAANVPLAESASTSFVVPPEATMLTGITSGSVPVSSDLAPNTGEPEVLGQPGAGNIAAAQISSPALSQGKWLLEADPVGVFSAPVQGTANLALEAHMQGFDGAVGSSTGDQWLGSVAATPPAFTPVAVAAGQSGTITVTITPTAARGTVVSGYLYVDDTTVVNNAGAELTAIPYTYTVG